MALVAASTNASDGRPVPVDWNVPPTQGRAPAAAQPIFSLIVFACRNCSR